MSSLNAQPFRPKMRLTVQSTVADLPIYTPADDTFNFEAEAERESLHAHFKHHGVQERCNHCIYFKGIVWKALSHHDDATAATLKDDEERPPEDIPARVPRLLESVAIEEEIREKKEHVKYMHWCETERAKVGINPSLARKRKYAADTSSTALADILNSMSKEQMTAWLKKKRDGDHIGKQNKDREDSQADVIDESDEIDDLQYQSMENIRAYILRTRGQLQVEPQKKKAKTVLRAPKGVAGSKALVAWYDKNKAPELKAEVSRRGIRPVPSKQADMVEVLLVRDDLRGK